jgi:hypothetical protein
MLYDRTNKEVVFRAKYISFEEDCKRRGGKLVGYGDDRGCEGGQCQDWVWAEKDMKQEWVGKDKLIQYVPGYTPQENPKRKSGLTPEPTYGR